MRKVLTVLCIVSSKVEWETHPTIILEELEKSKPRHRHHSHATRFPHAHHKVPCAHSSTKTIDYDVIFAAKS